jgi:hypothetical protein
MIVIAHFGHWTSSLLFLLPVLLFLPWLLLATRAERRRELERGSAADADKGD